MLREIRSVNKRNHAKAIYLYRLQQKGRLKKIVNAKGFVCYDTEDLKNYRAKAKRGRPIKTISSEEQ